MIISYFKRELQKDLIFIFGKTKQNIRISFHGFFFFLRKKNRKTKTW